ncbi:hypothetical protein E2562_035392 [Oryza meyeriana var. granulata]|uniref:Uncharacterized protein n=1 Tax=Oryza meyeriana var. granulata TaxID=110450 RepID=A0A6G1E6T8_9ORYZ|nr:hypothetical protein E2562_035392 [Oryza meyeriana var. granulata]
MAALVMASLGDLLGLADGHADLALHIPDDDDGTEGRREVGVLDSALLGLLKKETKVETEEFESTARSNGWK